MSETPALDAVREALRNRGYEIIHSSKIPAKPDRQIITEQAFHELERDIADDHIQRRINHQREREATGIWGDHNGEVTLGRKKAKIKLESGTVYAEIFREIK